MSDQMTVGRITFTPGPWRVHRLNYPAGEDVSFEVLAERPAKGHQYFIAQTIMREVAKEGERIAIDEANARLIAAAPEMLDALKRWVAAEAVVCDLSRRTSEQTGSVTADDMSRAITETVLAEEQAVAAIAKAEGRD